MAHDGPHQGSWARKRPRVQTLALILAVGSALLLSASSWSAATKSKGADPQTLAHARRSLEDGRQTFRFDTFGSEAFWGGMLRLHEAVAGATFGGVGPGLSPAAALALGLKVDLDALPRRLVNQLKRGAVDLDDPAVTLALLKLNAVVGVTGVFNQSGALASFGIQCALCHSVVDDSLSPGIGRRLDGWANRDLNIGAIVALAPNLQPFVDLLAIVHPGITEDAVRDVLNGWGPGKFDAELILDGKIVNATGGSAATLIPPAFGLAGVNLHTWTGWGSVTHWNAFVASLETHGTGTFFDPRLNDAAQFPIAAAAGFGNVRNVPDLITPKLASLHFYQLALPAPAPPPGSFTQLPRRQGRRGSRPRALGAMYRRSSPSPDGTFTRQRRSASTTSRPTGRPTGGTEPRR